jgi:hypothetical protein
LPQVANVTRSTSFLKNIKNLDFSPYLTYPFGTADPITGADSSAFEGATGILDFTSYVAGVEDVNKWGVYLFDAIVLYATAMQRLVAETGTDYFADGGRPPAALANTYIRSTELPEDVAVSGHIKLDSGGERELNLEVSYLELTEAGDSINNVPFALYEVDQTEPLSFGLHGVAFEEVVWAGGLVGGPPDGYFDNVIVVDGETSAIGYGINAGSITAGCVLVLIIYGVFAMKSKKKVSLRMLSLKRFESTLNRRSTELQLKTKKSLIQKNFVLDATNLIFDSGDTERSDGGKAHLLGKGAFGNVYLASYHGTKVAVKEIMNDMVNLHTVKEKNMGARAEELCASQLNELMFMQRIR